MGQADAEGNVNVSHLAGNLVGPGGFIEIAQNAKKVVFCGKFDAQGSEVAFEDGRLRIVKHGKIQKFVGAVERITFSGAYARQHGQEVLYVTERCVFQLDPEGLRLIEIAPGIEIERDILPFMAFRPIIGDVKRMNHAVFA
jgi:acyl CoA:acetate/3-ketoacid CoA transferase